MQFFYSFFRNPTHNSLYSVFFKRFHHLQSLTVHKIQKPPESLTLLNTLFSYSSKNEKMLNSYVHQKTTLYCSGTQNEKSNKFVYLIIAYFLHVCSEECIPSLIVETLTSAILYSFMKSYLFCDQY